MWTPSIAACAPTACFATSSATLALEAVGKTIEEAVHADDLPANLAQFDRVMRGDLPSFTMEKRFVRKDGEVVWTNV